MVIIPVEYDQSKLAVLLKYVSIFICAITLSACSNENMHDMHDVQLNFKFPADKRAIIDPNELFVKILVNDKRFILNESIDPTKSEVNRPISVPNNSQSSIKVYWFEKYEYTNDEGDEIFIELPLAVQTATVVMADGSLASESGDKVLRIDPNLNEEHNYVTDGVVPRSLLDFEIIAIQCNSFIIGGNPCSFDRDGDGMSNLEERETPNADPLDRKKPVCSPIDCPILKM